MSKRLLQVINFVPMVIWALAAVAAYVINFEDKTVWSTGLFTLCAVTLSILYTIKTESPSKQEPEGRCNECHREIRLSDPATRSFVTCASPHGTPYGSETIYLCRRHCRTQYLAKLLQVADSITEPRDDLDYLRQRTPPHPVLPPIPPPLTRPGRVMNDLYGENYLEHMEELERQYGDLKHMEGEPQEGEPEGPEKDLWDYVKG